LWLWVDYFSFLGFFLLFVFLGVATGGGEVVVLVIEVGDGVTIGVAGVAVAGSSLPFLDLLLDFFVVFVVVDSVFFFYLRIC